MKTIEKMIAMTATLGCLTMGSAHVVAAPLHVVDGLFGLAEWTVSPTNGAPARSTVTESSFNVGNSLYVEQTNNGIPVPFGGPIGNRLALMYDDVNSGGASGFDTAFDVLFQVGPEHTDYAVHIPSFGPLQAFEKPTGAVSLLKPDGSLNLLSAPWIAISPLDPDFLLANFVGAVGFGTSPNSSTPHLIAEFELSVDNGTSDGLYSPEPAFWSASTSNREIGRDCERGPFPESFCSAGPISSGIFTLNPDGTTTVVPVLGPNGEPLIQSVPAPSSLLLLGSGLALWIGVQRRRRACI